MKTAFFLLALGLAESAASSLVRGADRAPFLSPRCSTVPPIASWIALGLVPPQLPPGLIPPAQFIVTRLVLDPIQPDRMWVATSYGLLRSEDG